MTTESCGTAEPGESKESKSAKEFWAEVAMPVAINVAEVAVIISSRVPAAITGIMNVRLNVRMSERMLWDGLSGVMGS